jgi:hypothetical protein
MPLLSVPDIQSGIQKIMDAKLHITEYEARMLALLIDDLPVEILKDQQAIASADREKYWAY